MTAAGVLRLAMVGMAAIPAVYAWWTAWRVVRARDDASLPERLFARTRRVAAVTTTFVMVLLLSGEIALAVATIVVVLAANHPVRRAVYHDEWSMLGYLRYTLVCGAADIGAAALLFLGPLGAIWLARAVAPPGGMRIAVALAAGVVDAALLVAWNARATRIWLAARRASPLAGASSHAALLPRLEAVLERARDRLPRTPALYRYGPRGGREANAMALMSRAAPAIAISDTLLEHLDADETTAIFAHEVAHLEEHAASDARAERRNVLIIGAIVAVLPALDLAGLIPVHPIFVLAAIPFVFPGLLMRGRLSPRRRETAADLRAVELTGDAESLVRALTTLHRVQVLPHHWGTEVERRMTHPSLARRINWIRARSGAAAHSAWDALVFASPVPGSFVVLEHERAHWLDGVPAGTPLELAALRKHARSERAIAYERLAELALVVEDASQVLRATDHAGRAWSIRVRDEDVAALEAALEEVDARRGDARTSSFVMRPSTGRLAAAAVSIAAAAALVWGPVTLAALVVLIAPSTFTLASLATLAVGTAIAALTGTMPLVDHGWVATAALALAGGWSGWIAWRWRATGRGLDSRLERAGAIVLVVLLAGYAVVSVLAVLPGRSPVLRDLLGAPGWVSVLLSLAGIGSGKWSVREGVGRET
jgi:Zn-dependent protease with chaperone function